MKAVIMAGGKGTRLRPLTCLRPKPMVPILNLPIMEHIIQLLKMHGITEIAVTLQYQPEKIKDYFQDGQKWGVNLVYSVEKTPLGTAGSVKKIEDFLDDTFLVISGDALTDFNLSEIIAFHEQKRALATLALTTILNPCQFGIVELDDFNRIIRFLEKPAVHQIFTNTINTGIYVLEPKILKLMEPYQQYDFSRDIFPLLLQLGKPLFGIVMQGYWCDIGTLEQYKQANFDALQGRVKLHGLPELDQQHLGQEQLWQAANSSIDGEAQISGPLWVGRNSKIQAGAKIIGPTVIGDDCIIGEGAVINNSLIWNEVHIGSEAKISAAQVSSNCQIEAQSQLLEDTFVGDNCYLGQKCLLQKASKIWPHNMIPKGVTVQGNYFGIDTEVGSG